VSIPSACRLLQLTSSADIGGTEQMLFRFLGKINRQKFNVRICSLVGSGRLTQACQRLGYQAWNLRLASPLQLGKLVWLYKLCRSERIQLIHTYGLRADTVGRFIAHIAGVPVIVSSIRGPDEQRGWWHVMLDRLTARWVDLFISNSEAGRQSRITRERFPPEKIVQIGIGQVPEGRQLFNPLTVTENLELGAYLRYRRDDKRKITKDMTYVLELFPILIH